MDLDEKKIKNQVYVSVWAVMGGSNFRVILGYRVYYWVRLD